MPNERVFDAAALEEYRRFLQDLLDELENDVIPVLATGTLSRVPAFGSAPEAVESALPEYVAFHAAAWRNLQHLRGTLQGLTTALADTVANSDEGHFQAYLEFTGLETGDGTAETA